MSNTFIIALIASALIVSLALFVVLRKMSNASTDDAGKQASVRRAPMATSVTMGAALGAALGVAMDNVGFGIAIGVAVGVAIGVARERRLK